METYIQNHYEFLEKEVFPNIDNIENNTARYMFRNITNTDKMDIQENSFVTIRDTFYVFECIFKKNNKYYHGMFYADGAKYVKKIISL